MEYMDLNIWNRQTLLQAAAFNCCLNVAQLLINTGAEIDKADKYGILPKGWATKAGRECAEWISPYIMNKSADLKEAI